MTLGSRLARWLFPTEYRSFPGKRWVNILLRTVHLVGVAGLGGAFLYRVPSELPNDLWMPWLFVTLISGVLMLALEVWSNGAYLVQGCGLAVLAKILLLAVLPLFEPPQTGLFLLVMVLSGLASHAPARVRHYVPFPYPQLASEGRKDISKRRPGDTVE